MTSEADVIVPNASRLNVVDSSDLTKYLYRISPTMKST